MGRKLGQHFLKDESALRKIAAALEIGPRDTVIEIGPGHGELTKYLLEAKPAAVTTIERDSRLAANLRNNFPGKKLEVVEGDALEILPNIARPHTLNHKPYKVVGNIPYYITGYLLRILGELNPKPKLIVLTVQKEVAERVCAAPPKMNLLAASVQFWAKPEIVMTIKSGLFSPPPKVTSAVLKLKPLAPKGIDPTEYYRLIKILFKQPRKTILNNLVDGLGVPRGTVTKLLTRINISPADRPQTLGTNALATLSDALTNQK